MLRRFISDRGKIRSRRITGACRRHQSQVARAVKRARELALLPYVAEGGNDHRERGRRGDRDRDRDTRAVADTMPQAILLQTWSRSASAARSSTCRAGYLRNYLVPRKLAEPATARPRSQAAQRRRETPSGPRGGRGAGS